MSRTILGNMGYNRSWGVGGALKSGRRRLSRPRSFEEPKEKFF